MNNRSRFEMKVGIFVFSGIVLIGLLMLNFSKGISLFTPTYQIKVLMPTIAGLKPKAAVMISGVSVGNVISTELSPAGTNVTIVVKILKKIKIHSDANFHIDALGFLGDQYLAITPTRNEGEILKDGDVVTGQAPFNLQEAVRSTAGLLQQARMTMQNLDQAIQTINQTILSPATMTNFGNTISNMQAVTASAKRTTEEVESLVKSNSLPLSDTVANLRSVSARLSSMADQLEETVSTNRSDITATVKDLRSTAHNFNQLSTGLLEGKGVAGTLLRDDETKAQVAAMIANINSLSSEMNRFSSNLNKRGLWSMLKKPKETDK